MRILLLGSGGREHALAWKLAQSRKCDKLYIAPGNAGTALVGENVAINVSDFDALKAFAVDNRVDMVVVGPEDPLVKGIYDCFKEDARTSTIPVIGPSKQGAVLATQFGDGWSNTMYPTNASYMATLAVAKVNWTDWLKFQFPLQLMWTGLSIVMLFIAQTIQLGPF